MLKQGFKGGSYSYGIREGLRWVLDTQGMYGQKRVLSGYDLRTHERIAKLEVDNAVFGPVIWNGSVWLSTRGDPHVGHYIAKIDPRLKHTVGRISIPVAVEGARESDFLPPLLVADGDSLWALSGNWWSKRTPVILEALQYLTARMTSGKHSCNVGNQGALEFVVEPGEERFIYVELQKQIFTLALVSVGEGEDGTANSEPVKRKP
jgi:hypothetical protein